MSIDPPAVLVQVLICTSVSGTGTQSQNHAHWVIEVSLGHIPSTVHSKWTLVTTGQGAHCCPTTQGFVQTLGSDTWLRLDPTARQERLEMVQAITHSVYSEGYFSANWTTNAGTPQPLAIMLSQTVNPGTTYDDYAYVGTGCYRSPHWPWYLKSAPWYTSMPCIPLFALLLAFWNGQDWRTARDKKQLSIMVVLGCISYAANTTGERLIHGTVGNVIGAFTVSLAGSIYERVFHGFAFVVMVPGVLFLVPVSQTACL